MLEKFTDPRFIEAIAKLLWPISVLVIALVYREQIKTLLRRVRSAKLFGNEVNFAVEELRVKVDQAIEKPTADGFSGWSLPEVPQRTSSKDEPEDGSIRHDEIESRARSWLSYIQKKKTDLEFGHGIRLLERPIPLVGVENIRNQLESEPLTSVLLVAGKLEYAMRLLLAAEGDLELGESKNARKLLHKIGKKYNLSHQFHAAVRKFYDVRNSVAHHTKEFTSADLIEIGESGLELIELIQRIPRNIIIVERAGLPVYADKKQTTPLAACEAIVLTFAAMPGQTGATIPYVTRRTGYYKVEHQVSSEWEEIKDVPAGWPVEMHDDKKVLVCWILEPGQTCPRKLVANKVFIGRHLSDLI